MSSGYDKPFYESSPVTSSPSVPASSASTASGSTSGASVVSARRGTGMTSGGSTLRPDAENFFGAGVLDSSASENQPYSWTSHGSNVIPARRIW